MRELVEQCSEFFDSVGASYHMLSRLMRVHFNKKQWLSSIFGFNKENGWRVKLEMPHSLEHNHRLLSLFEYIEFCVGERYHIDYNNFVFVDDRKNIYRPTKLIDDNWETLKSNCGVNAPDRIKVGMHAFIELYRKSSEGGKKDTAIKSTVLCSFGDLVKQGKIIVISINPFDFITASAEKNSDGSAKASKSEKCAYTSCIGWGGGYFQTVLDYLNSNCVMITYTATQDKPLYKTGRMFVYLLKNMFLQTRQYGAYSDFEKDLLTLYLSSKLKGNFIRLNDEENKQLFTINGRPYIDYMGYPYLREGAKKEKFIIETGLCLSCGRKLKNHSGEATTCDSCHKTKVTCSYCGCSVLPNNVINTESGSFCPKCIRFHGLDNCSACGILTLRPLLTSNSTGRLCQRCYAISLEGIKGNKPSANLTSYTYTTSSIYVDSPEPIAALHFNTTATGGNDVG